MTILASPMLGTLDVALYEDSLDSGHKYRVKRSLSQFEAVLSGRRAGHVQCLIETENCERTGRCHAQNLFDVYFLCWLLIHSQLMKGGLSNSYGQEKGTENMTV